MLKLIPNAGTKTFNCFQNNAIKINGGNIHWENFWLSFQNDDKVFFESFSSLILFSEIFFNSQFESSLHQKRFHKFTLRFYPSTSITYTYFLWTENKFAKKLFQNQSRLVRAITDFGVYFFALKLSQVWRSIKKRMFLIISVFAKEGNMLCALIVSMTKWCSHNWWVKIIRWRGLWLIL